MVMDFVSQYWGIILAFAIGVIYVLTYRQVATAYVKNMVPKLMLAAEKYAEDLILTNGEAKLNWVVNEGYNYLPAMVRMVISKPLFAVLAQTVYNEAVKYAKAHVADQSSEQISTENK